VVHPGWEKRPWRYARQGAKGRYFLLNDSAGEVLCKKIGNRVLFAKVDVTSAASVEAGIKKTIETFGALHICVNCAGVPNPGKTIGKNAPLRLESFTKVIDINLNGTFNVIRLAAFEMAKNKPLNDSGERGVVVNTASAAAFEGQMGQAAYAASKAGVCGMTLPIARDLSSLGIRVVTIAPGLFLTPMAKVLPQEAIAKITETIEFPKRLGDPSEFGALVAHIIENTYFNGEVIRLDAATRLRPR